MAEHGGKMSDENKLLELYTAAMTAVWAADKSLNEAMRQASLLQTELKTHDPVKSVEAEMERIIKAMRPYGRKANMMICTDGSGSIYACDGYSDYCHHLFSFRNLAELFACDPAKWPSIETVQKAWEVAKPVPRAGDYRDPETWRNRF